MKSRIMGVLKSASFRLAAMTVVATYLSMNAWANDVNVNVTCEDGGNTYSSAITCNADCPWDVSCDDCGYAEIWYCTLTCHSYCVN
jgi:hypothetical protein